MPSGTWRRLTKGKSAHDILRGGGALIYRSAQGAINGAPTGGEIWRAADDAYPGPPDDPRVLALGLEPLRQLLDTIAGGDDFRVFSRRGRRRAERAAGSNDQMTVLTGS